MLKNCYIFAFCLGEFTPRHVEKPMGPIERSQAIRQPDNLTTEGEFYQRPQQAAPMRGKNKKWHKFVFSCNLLAYHAIFCNIFNLITGDRADIKKPVDNLRPEGTAIFFSNFIKISHWGQLLQAPNIFGHNIKISCLGTKNSPIVRELICYFKKEGPIKFQ